MAVKSDGTVWAWGRNEYGQLGGAVGTVSTVPSSVEGVKDIDKIESGAHHCLALRSDGTVWEWGWNYPMQTKNSPPTRLGAFAGIGDIAAGLHYSVILKKY